jgi:hypothetical protein
MLDVPFREQNKCDTSRRRREDQHIGNTDKAHYAVYGGMTATITAQAQ